VAPQPNYDEKFLNGKDHYDQDYDNRDNGRLFGSYYQRTVGGAMMHWQGISIRMVPTDFSLTKAFGLKTKTNEILDWPIGYDNLERFYHQAEAEMGVAGSEEMDHLLGVPRPSGGYPMQAVELSYHDLQFMDALRRKGSKFSFPDSGYELGVTEFNLTATPQARNTVEGYQGRRACEGYGTCIPLCPTGAKYESRYHLNQPRN